MVALVWCKCFRNVTLSLLMPSLFRWPFKAHWTGTSCLKYNTQNVCLTCVIVISLQTAYKNCITWLGNIKYRIQLLKTQERQVSGPLWNSLILSVYYTLGTGQNLSMHGAGANCEVHYKNLMTQWYHARKKALIPCSLLHK